MSVPEVKSGLTHNAKLFMKKFWKRKNVKKWH